LHYSDNLNTLLKESISLEIKQMDQVIDSALSGKHLIKIISEHLIYSGGKRLRPSLTILIAKLLGYHDGTDHINLAAAIEFIHTATLLHDDVIDASDLRRGKKTSNSIWGNQITILVGDYLLSQAFQIMVQTKNIVILDILSKASSIIAEGEILQFSLLSDFRITEEKYIEIIRAKTAELFGAATSIGAVLTNQDAKIIENFYSFGINFGTGFQIIDDILDYSGSSNEMGKEAGDDFREGKITLPILMCYQDASSEDKEFIEKVFSASDYKTQENFEIIKNIMAKSNAIDKSFHQAQYYIEQAKSCLSISPDCIEKGVLLDLLDFSLKRIY
jgi:octaprenyl-diphosphate synthase